MPYWTFQIANFISPFVWVWSLLAIGDLGAGLLQWLA
jgi:membrane protein DedA with SNARE-associated domain